MTGEKLEIGDIVETIKGAKFWGRLDSFYKDGWGAVVVAIDPGFDGCTHVYPLSQLQRRASSGSEPAAVPSGWKLVPEEPTRKMWAAAGTAVVTIRERSGSHDHMSEAVWQAMLSASPQEPTPLPVKEQSE